MTINHIKKACRDPGRLFYFKPNECLKKAVKFGVNSVDNAS